jgi:hypothetical protein
MNSEALPAEPYKKIFILTLGDNNGSRSVVENAFADAAQKKGFETVVGSEVLPSGFSAEKPDKELIEEKILESEADAVFTVALLHSRTQERYVPESTPPLMISYPFYGTYYSYNCYSDMDTCMILATMCRKMFISSKETCMICVPKN